jgi:integrase
MALTASVGALFAIAPTASRTGPACPGHSLKRARQRTIDYLEYDEIDAVLKVINRTTEQGSRDYALLATMFATGDRVQEIAILRVCDPPTDHSHTASCRGAGNAIVGDRLEFPDPGSRCGRLRAKSSSTRPRTYPRGSAPRNWDISFPTLSVR